MTRTMTGRERRLSKPVFDPRIPNDVAYLVTTPALGASTGVTTGAGTSMTPTLRGNLDGGNLDTTTIPPPAVAPTVAPAADPTGDAGAPPGPPAPRPGGNGRDLTQLAAFRFGNGTKGATCADLSAWGAQAEQAEWVPIWKVLCRNGSCVMVDPRYAVDYPPHRVVYAPVGYLFAFRSEGEARDWSYKPTRPRVLARRRPTCRVVPAAGRVVSVELTHVPVLEFCDVGDVGWFWKAVLSGEYNWRGDIVPLPMGTVLCEAICCWE